MVLLTEKKSGLYVGVNLEIQGKDIMLAPKTPINQIAEKGIELELPNNLYLGKAKEIVDGIAEEFGYKPADNKKISQTITGITVVDKLIAKVMDAELTISDLYIKVYPEPQDKNGKRLIDKGKGDGKFWRVDIDPITSNEKKEEVTVEADKVDKSKYMIGTDVLLVPPKATEYTLGLAATWSAKSAQEEEKLGSQFKVKGLYLMITNEDLNVIEARRLKQKSLAASAS
ncbi:hypothetical protein [Nostoc sp.]|uniref:hypothetical protein n=1 Tax=Nostoc sp. TaxID=1180 RepID=UPI002FFC4157